MLRAAETVRSACLTHFIVEQGEDRTRVEESVTPASTTTTVEKVKQKDGTFKKVERTEHTPESVDVIVRPGADLYIRALAVRPGESPPEGAVSADEVLSFVSPRVKRRKDASPFTPPVCSGRSVAVAQG
jgi:hypothetical protein